MSRVSIISLDQTSLLPVGYTLEMSFFRFYPPLNYGEESISSVVFAQVTNLGKSIKLVDLELQLSLETHYYIIEHRSDKFMLYKIYTNRFMFRTLDAAAQLPKQPTA